MPHSRCSPSSPRSPHPILTLQAHPLHFTTLRLAPTHCICIAPIRSLNAF